MPVAKSAFAASEELYFLSVFRYVSEEFPCLGIEHRRAHGHFDCAVFSVLAERAPGSSRLSVGGEYVSLISQMEQRPYVAVASQDYMASAAAVAAVGAAFGYILRAVEMAASRASFA